MKKIATKFVLAATATFFAGAVMAQTDTTATPTDTTAVPAETTPVETPAPTDTTAAVPDTTSPNAKVNIDNSVSLTTAFTNFSKSFYATDRELLNSKQNAIKSEEESEA